MKADLGVKCETCGSMSGLTASHYVKKNSVHKSIYSNYNYESCENYFTQCLECHMEYEKLPVRAKTAGIVTRQEYMLKHGFERYAQRIEYLIGERT